MSFELMIPAGFLAMFYMLFQFMDSLAEGEHEMLKFGVAGFALVGCYQMWVMIASISQESADATPGAEQMLGRWIWIYGTVMIVVLSYFLYSLLIRYLDWRNWKKKKNPFDDTDRRYFR